MIHEIDATTGEITRTWDTGTYWINHQAYIDLDLIPYLGGAESHGKNLPTIMPPKTLLTGILTKNSRST